MSEPMFGRKAAPTRDDPAVFKSRRFSDSCSPLNDELHDQTRLLAAAVEAVDRLGIEVMAVEADRRRNKRVQVRYSQACDAREGVEVKRTQEWSHWTANRFGVEIVWCIPAQEAA